MARKFILSKEIEFINRVSKELVQRVVGQEVIYYSIQAEKTRPHDLYNESVQKVWSSPVRANALVYYENSQEQVGSLPPDAKFNLDVYFHAYELKERNLEPRMGDFLYFGEIFFEILSVTKPQMIFGQIEQKVMVKCNCSPAREGQFSPPRPPSRAVLDQILNAPVITYSPQQAFVGPTVAISGTYSGNPDGTVIVLLRSFTGNLSDAEEVAVVPAAERWIVRGVSTEEEP